MTTTELLIDAIIGGVWSLERWDDVSTRIMVATITMNFTTYDHEAIGELLFLAEIASERAK